MAPIASHPDVIAPMTTIARTSGTWRTAIEALVGPRSVSLNAKLPLLSPLSNVIHHLSRGPDACRVPMRRQSRRLRLQLVEWSWWTSTRVSSSRLPRWRSQRCGRDLHGASPCVLLTATCEERLSDVVIRSGRVAGCEPGARVNGDSRAAIRLIVDVLEMHAPPSARGAAFLARSSALALSRTETRVRFRR